MADRLFAGIALLITLGYTWMAFTTIRAPFQYDPLGPESWPRILGIAASLCLLHILVRPDVPRIVLPLRTAGRLLILLVLLFGYAQLFEPLGFTVSTILFCVLLALMLGAKPGPALLFGAATGIVGYFGGTGLLELNLPAGLLAGFL